MLAAEKQYIDEKEGAEGLRIDERMEGSKEGKKEQGRELGWKQ